MIGCGELKALSLESQSLGLSTIDEKLANFIAMHNSPALPGLNDLPPAGLGLVVCHNHKTTDLVTI